MMDNKLWLNRELSQVCTNIQFFSGYCVLHVVKCFFKLNIIQFSAFHAYCSIYVNVTQNGLFQINFIFDCDTTRENNINENWIVEILLTAKKWGRCGISEIIIVEEIYFISKYGR